MSRVFERSDSTIRFPKNRVDPDRPWHFLHESEPDDGEMVAINTLFLTGRECPFRCVMCDLWKNTLDGPTPPGAIPRQIRYALERLPPALRIKLYNSGNFFDRQAVPVDDWPQIATLLKGYERVIVENHPKLCDAQVPRFRDLLGSDLEVALGLETVHPEALRRLNKQMTTDSFAGAVRFLQGHDIRTRAFILLNPPWIAGEEENRRWCLKSVEFAVGLGVETCTIIPTRAGNRAMKSLQENGEFSPPPLRLLEEVFEEALAAGGGRIFVDTWDLHLFSSCEICREKRMDRLGRMNLLQKSLPAVRCSCDP